LPAGNAVYQRNWDPSTWSPWHNIGIQGTNRGVVCSMAPFTLCAFTKSTNNALWRNSYDRAWNGCSSIAGQLASSPCAAAWGRNPGPETLVFCQGENPSHISQRTYV